MAPVVTWPHAMYDFNMKTSTLNFTQKPTGTDVANVMVVLQGYTVKHPILNVFLHSGSAKPSKGSSKATSYRVHYNCPRRK